MENNSPICFKKRRTARDSVKKKQRTNARTDAFQFTPKLRHKADVAGNSCYRQRGMNFESLMQPPQALYPTTQKWCVFTPPTGTDFVLTGVFKNRHLFSRNFRFPFDRTFSAASAVENLADVSTTHKQRTRRHNGTNTFRTAVHFVQNDTHSSAALLPIIAANASN